MIRLTTRAAIAAAAAVALAPLCAAAAEPVSDAELNYNIMGPSDCARWPRSGALSSAAKAVPLNWALGFLSGSAAATDKARLAYIDPEAVAGWLDSYCRDHPTAPLPRAARAYEQELDARLNPPPPPPIVLSDPPAKAAPAAPPARPRTPARRSSRPRR
jgi:hypothetical protein